jgi:hypothetical protein
MRIVIISFPDRSDDTGVEVYGPFENPMAQDKWVQECQEAAERGWNGLKGAQYVLTDLVWPFDPAPLAQAVKA